MATDGLQGFKDWVLQNKQLIIAFVIFDVIAIACIDGYKNYDIQVKQTNCKNLGGNLQYINKSLVCFNLTGEMPPIPTTEVNGIWLNITE